MMRTLAVVLALLCAGIARAEIVSSGGSFKPGSVTKSIVPATNNAINLGSATRRWAGVFGLNFSSGTGSAWTATADVADSGTNAAFTFNNSTALTGSTVLAKFGSNGSYKMEVEDDGSVIPVTTQGPSLGRTSRVWAGVYSSNYYDTNGAARIVVNGSSGSTYTGRVGDSGTNVAHSFDNSNALTGTTLLARFGSNGFWKLQIEDDGTITPGTNGGASLGSSALAWGTGYIGQIALGQPNGAILDGAGSERIRLRATGTDALINIYTSRVANGATAIGHKFANSAALTTDGAQAACFYSDSGTTLAACISAEGGIRPNAGGVARPTCGADFRGQIWYTPGGAGVADVWEKCHKDAADSYAWVAY